MCVTRFAEPSDISHRLLGYSQGRCRGLASDFGGALCGGRAAPGRLFLKWYRTGDVIFYDLEARRRLGVERPNLALHLQKWYDTFSHSAIFLWCVPPPDPSGAPLLNWA